MNVFEKESQAIIEAYHRRSAKDQSCFYNLASPSCAVSCLNKLKFLLKILSKTFSYDFVHKKYLEVGCGTGTNLCTLISFGINPEFLYGNDVFLPSLEMAKKRLPSSIHLQEGNFLDCKYENQSFEVIFFSTVLSSILDENFRNECLKRSYDLLAPNGIVIIYDFIYDNPWNKDVRGINLRALKQSANWRKTQFSHITLCPPLARKLERFPFLIKALESLKILNTHVIGFLQK